MTQRAGRGDLPETVLQRSAHDPGAMSPLSPGDEGLGGRIDLQPVLMSRWLDGAGPRGRETPLISIHDAWRVSVFSPGEHPSCLQSIWVQRAVCKLLAFNVGSQARLLAPNVSRKRPLFASPSATVCRPLQLNGDRTHSISVAGETTAR
jgi:hypothetical protein